MSREDFYTNPDLDQQAAWGYLNTALLALAEAYGVDPDTLAAVIGEGTETAIRALQTDAAA